ERAAEQQHAAVGHQRETRRHAGQLLEVAARARIAWNARKACCGQVEPKRAAHVADDEADMAEEGAIEALEPASAVRSSSRLDLLAHERVAANRTLAEDDHRAGEDVRAFDRDRDGRRLIGPREIVARP